MRIISIQTNEYCLRLDADLAHDFLKAKNLVPCPTGVVRCDQSRVLDLADF